MTAGSPSPAKGRRRLPRRACLAAVLLVLAPLSGSGMVAADGEPVVRSTAIPRFDIGAPGTRFGALDYVGGFSYVASDRRLAGVSGIRLTRNRSHFVAVTDTGYWFTGRILRDAAGRPTGIGEAAIAPILSAGGQSRARRKGDADAEGLAVDGARVLVTYERTPRIEAFSPEAGLGDLATVRPQTVPSPIPRRELRSNAGMEAIAVSPRDGKAIVVTEQSIDADGNLFAAILGPGGGVFKVRREEPWHVTDAAFLPEGGDLLILERRYEGFGRVGMRIRRIAAGSIAVGTLVDGTVLMEADLSEEIDNMEGLDASLGPDGATYLTLVSDDNGSFFQRNLFLEFRLDDDAAASPSN